MIRRRYTLIGLILFLSISRISLAQITIFPDVDNQSEESVNITKIEISDIFTIIDFIYINTEEDVWICADKNFFIQPGNRDERKYLIMAEGIPLCPEKIKLDSYSPEREFRLYFPRIDTALRKIDVIEKPGSGFNYFGVWLDHSTVKPEPDSLEIFSEDDFEESFGNRSDGLQPLEGLWKLTMKQSHYDGEMFIKDLEEDTVMTVGILWIGDHYECYDMEGKSIESSFYNLAEGNRYVYKDYYREVREEATTYIKLDNPAEIKFQLKIPDRWAKYLLDGRYYQGDQVLKKLHWERQFPEIQDRRR